MIHHIKFIMNKVINNKRNNNSMERKHSVKNRITVQKTKIMQEITFQLQLLPLQQIPL